MTPVEATPLAERLETSEQIAKAIVGIPSRLPWEVAWIEMTMSKGLRPRLGFLIEEATVGDLDSQFRKLLKRDSGGQVVNDEDTIVTGNIYVSAWRSYPMLSGTFAAALGEDGAFKNLAAGVPEGVPHPEEHIHDVYASAGICLGVLAFLNCKNVTTADEPPPPPAVAKKRRKAGKPEIVYKQLIVDGRPVTRGPGRETPEEADFRYHITRGHFADHREHGLFGKESLKGIYWVPMHVRGSKANGEIVKDYKVQPPPSGLNSAPEDPSTPDA